MKKLFRFIKYGILFLLFILLLAIFIPKHYPLPTIQKRASTQFMPLSTGSSIAYTHLASKENDKDITIIYLHGGPGGRISDKSIELLSNFTNYGYDVLLYDQVGSGESKRLADIKAYTVERHINDLHEIISKLAKKKVILIGQSWGGILAAYYTGIYPNDIEKIILTNPGPIYPILSGLNDIVAPDSLKLKSPFYTNAQGNAKVKNIRTSCMKYLALQFGIKLAPDQEADEFNTFAGYEINKSTVADTSNIIKMSDIKSIPSLSGYYASIMTVQSLKETKAPREQLKVSNIPLLLLKSQYDNLSWGIAYEYLQLFYNHQLHIIPNAGHIIEIEQPELYIKYITAFLAETDTKTASNSIIAVPK